MYAERDTKIKTMLSVLCDNLTAGGGKGDICVCASWVSTNGARILELGFNVILHRDLISCQIFLNRDLI